MFILYSICQIEEKIIHKNLLLMENRLPFQNRLNFVVLESASIILLRRDKMIDSHSEGTLIRLERVTSAGGLTNLNSEKAKVY